ncbi:uncharacterized protein [Diadema setosum]|uniref:uncharacterized protein n=1 Tax=Diadema setosum TaxID=31175 RepID=UPI003B3AD615
MTQLRCLQKIEAEKAEGFMIVPNWPTQAWFGRLLNLLIDEPIILPIIRQHLQGTGLSDETTKIILSAWRQSTHKQYSVYTRKWLDFCNRRQTNPMQLPVKEVLDFLTLLFKNSGYSALNTARSALASVALTDGYTVSSHPLISRFMKGVFHLKPPRARYQTTWDVKFVLDYLPNLPELNSMSLKDLSLKTCMLIALVSAQRVQTLQLLNIDDIGSHMLMSPTLCTFIVQDLVKQSRPGRTGLKVALAAYPQDKRICVLACLNEYLRRTSSLRGQEKYLFISYRKPYKRVTTDTISRWLKDVMTRAGIDVDVYKAHSTRAATTSKAACNSVPMSEVLTHVGWSREGTFQAFYIPQTCRHAKYC